MITITIRKFQIHPDGMVEIVMEDAAGNRFGRNYSSLQDFKDQVSTFDSIPEEDMAVKLLFGRVLQKFPSLRPADVQGRRIVFDLPGASPVVLT